MNTYAYVGGNPVGFFDPSAEFRVYAKEVYDFHNDKYKWIYTINLSHGCVLEVIEDFVKGRFLPKWMRPFKTQAQKLIDDGYSGENDVKMALDGMLCACQNVDKGLEEILKGQGYSGGIAYNINEDKASKLIQKMKAGFDEACESDKCEELKDAYPWDSLLEKSRARGIGALHKYVRVRK